MIDQDTYEDQVARLDHDKIEQAALAVRSAIFSTGMSVTMGLASLNYEPANGTLYELIFAKATQIVPAGTRFAPEGLRDSAGNIGDGYVVVSKVNGAQTWAYPFALASGAFDVGYVASHTGMDFPDACAITALFRAISGLPVGS